MAKGKGKTAAHQAAENIPPDSAAAKNDSKGSAGNKDAPRSKGISLFPARSQRTGPAPGKTVGLIANLFRIILNQNKPIYQFTAEVDLVEAKESATGEKRKLSKELRRLAVDRAINDWKKRTNYKGTLPYDYVLDTTGSVGYALFDIFAGRQAKSGDSWEFESVELELDSIVDGKLAYVRKTFKVKFIQCSSLEIQRLFDYCKGKTTTDITTVQEPLRALNVIMRGQISSVPMNVLTRTNVFPFKKENQFNVSPGVLVNKGYFMSVRPTQGGLMLNVANTLSAFHEEIDLVGLLRNRFSVRDPSKTLAPVVIERLKKEIFNKQVEARHINYGTKAKPHYRRYRVGDISGSSKDKFTLVDKQTKKTSETSIEAYFLKEYKLKLQYPNLPVIVDRGRKIPIEVCHLIDKQRITRKMDPDETAKIIKESAVVPERHFASIANHVKEVEKMSQPLKDFGLSFDAKFIELEGRELPPIQLWGATKRDITPNDGQYDVRRERFFKPAKVGKWALAFLMDHGAHDEKRRNGDNELFGRKFSELYCRGGAMKGATIPAVEPKNINYLDIEPEQQLKSLLNKYITYLNTSKMDHAIMVLPRECPDWVYRYLQYLEVSVKAARAEGEKWTRLSCIKYQNFMQKIIADRGAEMFIDNLWLKHNTKLGGINFVLKGGGKNFLQDGYLFVSVDVCHPAPGDKLIQSVAAVVGMWDLTGENMSFCTRLRVQKKARENHSTIEDVGEIDAMVEEILQSFWLKKHKLPSKIVILRDGVSEGQFRIVLQSELSKVKAMLSRRYAALKTPVAPMSCLVVQKRHKIRFKRIQAHQGRRGPDFNIQPGTVVDSTVTHPTDFDFYMAPHKAIQGTSRAAHIYMIFDEIKFSQDEAQAMIHALSYLSPRCTKSTSIPTPVNLADLAAERGKNIVISWNDDNPHKLKEEDRLKELNKLLANLADSNYKNTLYYV